MLSNKESSLKLGSHCQIILCYKLAISEATVLRLLVSLNMNQWGTRENNITSQCQSNKPKLDKTLNLRLAILYQYEIIYCIDAQYIYYYAHFSLFNLPP